jgi:hypothetical protein
MNDLKEVVKKAYNFLNDMYGENKVRDILLEEVELNPDEDYWKITLSFLRKHDTDEAEEKLFGEKYERIYKTFHINKETKDVESMFMRTVDV